MSYLISVGLTLGLVLTAWLIYKLEGIREEKIRRNKASIVLSLLCDELKLTRQRLIDSKKHGYSRPFTLAFRDTAWKAFSDGGQLALIQDLALLTAIAEAYYYISQLTLLENRYFGVCHRPPNTWTRQVRSRHIGYFNMLYPEAKCNIEKAIANIDRLPTGEAPKQGTGRPRC